MKDAPKLAGGIPVQSLYMRHGSQRRRNAFSDVGHETGMAKAHLLLADIYLRLSKNNEMIYGVRVAQIRDYPLVMTNIAIENHHF